MNNFPTNAPRKSINETSIKGTPIIYNIPRLQPPYNINISPPLSPDKYKYKFTYTYTYTYTPGDLQELLRSINYEKPRELLKFIEKQKNEMNFYGSDLDFLFFKLKNRGELLQKINEYTGDLDPLSKAEKVNLKKFIETVNTMEVDTPGQIMGDVYKGRISSKPVGSIYNMSGVTVNNVDDNDVDGIDLYTGGSNKKKRRPSRRKSSKRKSSKRKSLKRKSLKRKSSKKKSSRKRK